MSNTHAHHKKAVEMIADRIRNQPPLEKVSDQKLSSSKPMEDLSSPSEKGGDPLTDSGAGGSVGKAPTAKLVENLLPKKEGEPVIVVSGSIPAC